MALIKYIYSDALFSFLNTEQTTPNIFSADNYKCVRRLPLYPILSYRTWCRNMALIKPTKYRGVILSHLSSAGGVSHTQHCGAKADEPRTGPQTIGCRSNVSHVCLWTSRAALLRFLTYGCLSPEQAQELHSFKRILDHFL